MLRLQKDSKRLESDLVKSLRDNSKIDVLVSYRQHFNGVLVCMYREKAEAQRMCVTGPRSYGNSLTLLPGEPHAGGQLSGHTGTSLELCPFREHPGALAVCRQPRRCSAQAVLI